MFGALAIASAVSDAMGAFTTLVAPLLAAPLATITFVLLLGEPMMILWLACAGATRAGAPALATSAA